MREREVRVWVPEEKLSFFLELMKELEINVSAIGGISMEQMKVVADRVRKSNENPDRLLSWDDVKDSFQV